MDHSSEPPPASTSVALVLHPTAAKAAQKPSTANQTRYGSEWEDNSQSDASILQYWRIVRRHRKTVLVYALVGLAIGFLASIPMKPVYRTSTTLEVLNFNDDFMNAKQASPVSTNDNEYDISAEQNQADLMQSASLLQRVSGKLGSSAQAVEKPPPASSGWRKWLHLPASSQTNDRERLIGKAAGALKVTVSPHTHLIKATVESSDRQLAADFLNTLSQEFIRQNMEARFSTSERNGEWLSHELEGARTKLRTAEAALQSYARESGLIFTDDNANVAVEKLQSIQQALWAASADRIAKQSRLELANSGSPDAMTGVLMDDPALRETIARMNDLRRQIASLTASVYTAKYDKVKAAQAELTVLQASFTRDRDNILKRVQSDYTEAARKESLLNAAYTAQVAEVTGQSEKTIQYNILKHDVESSRQLYDNMLQQMKQSAIASAVHVSNVRVVDKADIPNKAVSPDFRINSAVGCLAGMLLCIITVVVRDQTDRTVHQPEDVKFWTDLLVLGTIPSANVITKLRGRSSAALTSQPRVLSPIRSVALVTLQQKPSLIAEAFRSTLASLLFLAKHGNNTKVLVFTSANSGDGKTTAVSNLAIAAAEIGKRVLIIDADLRRPRMHEVFNLPNERGFSNALLEKLSDKDMLALIQQTSIPDLDLVTARPATQTTTHLLYSPNLSAFLNLVKADYDMILIDTPPMLHMPDARVIGDLADAVVLVARAEQTSRSSLIAAKDQLMGDRIPVLGTILNAWDPTHSNSDYHKYRSEYGHKNTNNSA